MPPIDSVTCWAEQPWHFQVPGAPPFQLSELTALVYEAASPVQSDAEKAYIVTDKRNSACSFTTSSSGSPAEFFIAAGGLSIVSVHGPDVTLDPADQIGFLPKPSMVPGCGRPPSSSFKS
ncbi:MAG: hypothetical protein ACK55I_19230, partial [bacterium]